MIRCQIILKHSSFSIISRIVIADDSKLSCLFRWNRGCGSFWIHVLSYSFTNYEIGKTMGEEHILICILTYASENARNNAIATAHDQRPATALPISAMRLLLRGLRIALARFFLLYRENREDSFATVTFPNF